MINNNVDVKNKKNIYENLNKKINALKKEILDFDVDDIETTLNYISLENDILAFDNNVKIIIVEGKSDRNFLKTYKYSENNEYLSLDFLKAEKHLNSNYDKCQEVNKQEQLKGKGNKELLKSLFSDDIFLELFEKNNIYAIVDKDYDEPYPLENLNKRLLSDDTHDLEMLILSSDDNIMYRINLENFNKNILDKSLFMAYQLAKLKVELVGQYHLRIPKKIDFNKFFDNGKLKTKEYISFIKESVCENIKQKNKNYYDKVIEGLQKYLNNKVEIKLSFKDFLKIEKKECLSLINGHDFLEIISYLCNADEFLLEKQYFKKYDYNNFEKTDLYKKMKENNLF